MKKILALVFLLQALLFAMENKTEAIETLSENSLKKAAEFYKAEEFETAIQLWKKSLDSGLRNAEILYNLGNAHYRLGRIGQAIFYYRSALELSPTDKDIQYNLKLAQKKARDKIDEGEENPILSSLFALHHALPLNTQLLLLSVLVWIIFLVSFFRVLAKSEKTKAVCIGVLFVFSIGFALVFVSAGYKIFQSESESTGVVTASSTEVMSGPGENYQTLNLLSEGTEFKVISRVGGWVEIAVGERVRGFVSLAHVGILDSGN